MRKSQHEPFSLAHVMLSCQQDITSQRRGVLPWIGRQVGEDFPTQEADRLHGVVNLV